MVNSSIDLGGIARSRLETTTNKTCKSCTRYIQHAAQTGNHHTIRASMFPRPDGAVGGTVDLQL